MSAALDEERGRVIGIGGLFIKSPDHETLRSWYEAKLRLRGSPAQGLTLKWRSHQKPEEEHLTVWNAFPNTSRYFDPSVAPFMINYIVDDLDALLEIVDGLIINDEEAHMLTGIRSPILAGKQLVKDHGLRFVVIKKGEHGCILAHSEGLAMLPAFPVENVTDPTGAGDCFAGGFMGYLAAAHEKDGNIHMSSVQQALAHGTIIASFAIESFSLDRLASLTKQEVAHRYERFAEMVKVG